MLRANYHTHTFRCRHAVGADEDYVVNAVSSGLTTLGFSDHSPMTFTTAYYSGFRMPLEETADYFSSLSALREKYAEKIKIYIGVEAEFYPDCFDSLCRFFEDYPLDYMILGQHFVTQEEFGGKSAFSKTDDPERLKEYYRNVVDAVDTGRFLYVAHPDVLNFRGDGTDYRRLTREFLLAMKARSVPMEINRLGLTEGRHYPRDEFWTLAGEIGVPAVIGLDAHDPKVLLDREGMALCEAYAAAHGVELLGKLL